MILQLELFADLTIEPTIAMKRGQATLVQCQACGTLVCTPEDVRRGRGVVLGPCPCCTKQVWIRQDYDGEGQPYPTGPFRFGAPQ